MKFNFIARTLVYEHVTSRTIASTPAPAGLDGESWRLATSDVIESAFRDDPRRLHRFRSYLHAQHNGLVLLRGGDWLAYGWCSNPQGLGPPHLPQLTARLGGYWIFGCHTCEAYRRQGIYKQLLTRLAALAAQREPLPRIHIDTYAENVPARCAILGSGFRPCGVISTCRLPSPFGGVRILGGRWRRDAPHPDLAREIANVPVAAIAREASSRTTLASSRNLVGLLGWSPKPRSRVGKRHTDASPAARAPADMNHATLLFRLIHRIGEKKPLATRNGRFEKN